MAKATDDGDGLTTDERRAARAAGTKRAHSFCENMSATDCAEDWVESLRASPLEMIWMTGQEPDNADAWQKCYQAATLRALPAALRQRRRRVADLTATLNRAHYAHALASRIYKRALQKFVERVGPDSGRDDPDVRRAMDALERLE